MKRTEVVDRLGKEETGRVYTYKVKAIVSSDTTGTRVWKKDFYVFLPARVDLQPGSKKVRDQNFKGQLTKWIRAFQRRKPGREIRLQVTDEAGRRLPTLESSLKETK